MPRSGRFGKVCLALMVCSTMWVGHRAESMPAQAVAVSIEIPSAVILRGAQGDNNLKAYETVFDSVGLKWRLASVADLKTSRTGSVESILVVPAMAARSLSGTQVQEMLDAVDRGVVLVTEGITPISQAFGFRAGRTVTVREIQELAYPRVPIAWRNPAQVTSFVLPDGATLLNCERHTRSPLAALISRGRGKCLLLAAELDPEQGEGYCRYPYLVQELCRAGVSLRLRSPRLSAFFDYWMQPGANVQSLAKEYREAGIAALHVGAWDFYDLESGTNEYLPRLIEACHRNGILVYAWLELPHVSPLFWDQHPEWREKTATGHDAHPDWRLLMNLADPECFKTVTDGIRRLLLNFDWDGVDVSELYFEGPSGPKAPGELTPFNRQVRQDFRARFGVDPVEIFHEDSPYFWKRDRSVWEKLVDYRVQLERELNERMLQMLTGVRNDAKPSLALTLLYVDNIYDPALREAVGADVHGVLPLLDKYDFTLVMEDPASVWHMGPRRYAELAQSYARMTRHTGRLGIDINIVDRVQRAFPTQKQTGSEFLQLFHYAGRNFATVMVYSAQTIYQQDLELVSYALASGASGEVSDQEARIESAGSVVFRLDTTGVQVVLDGNPWPCVGGDGVLLPAGTHRLAAARAAGADDPRLVRLNGILQNARYVDDKRGIEFDYRSDNRAIAVFNLPPRAVQVDGVGSGAASAVWVSLPAGQHRVHAAF